MSSKKNKKKQMNMGSEDVNEDLFGLEDEDFGEEINSRMNVTNISREVVTREEAVVGCFLQKNRDKKVPWILFSLLMQKWLFKMKK